MAAADRSEILDIPIEKLFNAISDVASYPRFATGVKKTESKGDNVWYFEVEMMKKLDYKIKTRGEMAPDKSKASFGWSLHESSFFKKNDGAWELKALGPNKTEARYKLDLEFNFPVPGFVLKGLIANALPKNIKDFFEEAKKR